MNLTKEILYEVKAKYVFCLMNNISILRDRIAPNHAYFIPKYTIGWTDMEIKDAPSAAVIPFCFFNGTQITRSNVQLVDLKLLEKI